MSEARWVEHEGRSHSEWLAERDDALPFRAFERAHRRMRLAQAELAEAHKELDSALASMLEAGYAVRGAELADEIEARAPIPPESFRAEDRADELAA